ncbi:hypothetical protein CHS0354_022800 [Potamilus streckersoni]|uniref:ADAMTS cysteine-rich domain-containing protein n=1 Tax=Potamilus streckersoni TaxID=2493646 RepID=A0AAE0S207_9BIVA|nr:hypothetical protein CHS0354_022800 [Potamilus streckersoni]
MAVTDLKLPIHAVPEMICRFMYCTDPKISKCVDTYFSAAPGTMCGIHMWCRQGLCVKRCLK